MNCMCSIVCSKSFRNLQLTLWTVKQLLPPPHTHPLPCSPWKLYSLMEQSPPHHHPAVLSFQKIPSPSFLLLLLITISFICTLQHPTATTPTAQAQLSLLAPSKSHCILSLSHPRTPPFFPPWTLLPVFPSVYHPLRSP